jgi:excisionase family DNA binding protein
MATRRPRRQIVLFKRDHPNQPRDPEILDVQATADAIGISKDAVYTLFKKGEIPARKVARRWRTTRDAVVTWLKRTSEEDTLARTLTGNDKQAITKALQSGKVNIKKRG